MNAADEAKIREIINAALNQPRRHDLNPRLIVLRGAKVKGQTEYSSESLDIGVIIDQPPEEQKLIDAIRKIKADLEILIGEFKATHVLKPPAPNTSDALLTMQAPQQPPEVLLKALLSPEQMELVESRRVGDVLLIKAKDWLGNEAWRSIYDRILAAGGKWVSAGKESHWELPLKVAKKEAPQ